MPCCILISKSVKLVVQAVIYIPYCTCKAMTFVESISAIMKKIISTFSIIVLVAQLAFAQSAADDSKLNKELIQLSKDKWQWMADKDANKLANLFDEKSVFVHMGGSWGKDQELNIIKSGGIHYKKADIHEVSVNIIENTAILLNKITLLAVVGGNEVSNPFMVTEVYIKKNGSWKLGSLSFTKLLN